MFSFQDVRMRPRHWGPLQHFVAAGHAEGSPAELGLWFLSGIPACLADLRQRPCSMWRKIRMLFDWLHVARRLPAALGNAAPACRIAGIRTATTCRPEQLRGARPAARASDAGGDRVAPSERADAPATTSLPESQLANAKEMLGVPVEYRVADNFDLGGSRRWRCASSSRRAAVRRADRAADSKCGHAAAGRRACRGGRGAGVGRRGRRSSPAQGRVRTPLPSAARVDSWVMRRAMTPSHRARIAACTRMPASRRVCGSAVVLHPLLDSGWCEPIGCCASWLSVWRATASP